MSFRTVVVKQRAKLDYQLGYFVCRGEREVRIHISEITNVIVESTAVSMTAALLSEMVKRKIKVIFCDEKHLPQSQLVGYADHYRSSGQLRKQLSWTAEAKEAVWQSIVRKKIIAQADHLKLRGKDKWEMLYAYAEEVLPGDPTNREGHAAKVYFNELFGNTGRRCATFRNAALNYGYAILLAAFARELTAYGCILQLGIWHANEFNHFNLASDAMETFRVMVDDIAFRLDEDDSEMKGKMVRVLNSEVKIGGKKYFLDDAIGVFVRNLVDHLNIGSADVLHWESYTTEERG